MSRTHSKALWSAWCASVVAAEIVGMALMWVVAPAVWIRVGEQVGGATGSLAGAVSTTFVGFVATVVVIARGLARMDRYWIAQRCRAGYKQREGALTQVVVIWTTFGLFAFDAWYYVFSDALVLPFMPMR